MCYGKEGNNLSKESNTVETVLEDIQEHEEHILAFCATERAGPKGSQCLSNYFNKHSGPKFKCS